MEISKEKIIHVVGASGTEGSAILDFLVKNGFSKIIAHDFSMDKEELKRNFFKTHLWLKGKEKFAAFENFLKLPIKLNLKDRYLEGVLDADIIFVPSSWYLYKPNFPALENAKNKGIEFGSLTKLYFSLAKGKIISVTGTKGKGTTSKLIFDILNNGNANRKVHLAGNDRRSAQELDTISKTAKDDILVLETSNRQLMIDLGKSPDIGVITNISPDHIDEHGSFEKYIEVKKNLFRYSEEGNIAVLNFDNDITKKIGEDLIKRKVKVFFFSRKTEVENGAFLENSKVYINIREQKIEVCDLADIKLIGRHNIENVMAAAMAGYLTGAKPEEIKKTVQDFRGLPHRIEFIGEYGGVHPVKSRKAGISSKTKLFNGVKFYDDLASTNPDSTIAAINALKEIGSESNKQRLILIAGGDDKDMDYENLAKTICEKADLLILLPGTGTNKLKSQILNYRSQNLNFQKTDFKLLEADDFSEALEVIRTQIKTGDTVLVSPASAHFQARYIDVFKKPLRNIFVEKFR